MPTNVECLPHRRLDTTTGTATFPGLSHRRTQRGFAFEGDVSIVPCAKRFLPGVIGTVQSRPCDRIKSMYAVSAPKQTQPLHFATPRRTQRSHSKGATCNTVFFSGMPAPVSEAQRSGRSPIELAAVGRTECLVVQCFQTSLPISLSLRSVMSPTRSGHSFRPCLSVYITSRTPSARMQVVHCRTLLYLCTLCSIATLQPELRLCTAAPSSCSDFRSGLRSAKLQSRVPCRSTALGNPSVHTRHANRDIGTWEPLLRCDLPRGFGVDSQAAACSFSFI